MEPQRPSYKYAVLPATKQCFQSPSAHSSGSSLSISTVEPFFIFNLCILHLRSSSPHSVERRNGLLLPLSYFHPCHLRVVAAGIAIAENTLPEENVVVVGSVMAKVAGPEEGGISAGRAPDFFFRDIFSRIVPYSENSRYLGIIHIRFVFPVHSRALVSATGKRHGKFVLFVST